MAEGNNDTALRRLEALHAAVDAAVKPLAVLHGSRLQCRVGCSACCVDELSVFEIEAKRIRQHHAALLATGVPHPDGACAFLDPASHACRIYPDRPYVCRTQGLPLRWVEESEEDGELSLLELRDICPLNESDEPIEELDEEACWTLGPTEEKLAEIAHSHKGGARVSLRSLFDRQPTAHAE